MKKTFGDRDGKEYYVSQVNEAIHNVEQLEDVMTRPGDELVEFVKTLSGDLMVLGAGGKIGPSLCMLARRAFKQAGVNKKVIAVGRSPLTELEAPGVQTIQCDLLDPQQVSRLPDVENIIFMAGRKFGSSGAEHLTWAINVLVPHNVAAMFTSSRIVCVSTGCVYPVMDLAGGGATEDTPPAPVGEYAMSCLGRERVFDYYASVTQQKVLHYRLNYALDLRYGVLVDIARKVFAGEPVDVTTGYFNAIWQGDACDRLIRSLAFAANPPAVLNITGPEVVSVRAAAIAFGKAFDKKPIFTGQENGKGYLSDATRANTLFGYPRTPIGKLIDWTAAWVKEGGRLLGKPTHFETQDGRY
jgi:nucleoside-diphosphate-sugar epimerase